MGRAIRDRDPSAYRLITIRTVEARLWIGAGRNVEKLIGGILARYQELLGIEMTSYVFLGNHFHLIIRAPQGNTDEFLENVNREMARRINWKNQRRGKFWERRYTDQKILSEEDLLEAFLYVNTNPTHHGLVTDSADWPGLISYHQVLSERERRFSFYHFSASEQEHRVTTHSLKLTPLPQFKHLSGSERKNAIQRLLAKRTAEIVETRQKNGLSFLGREGISSQTLGAIPQNVSKKPHGPGYSKNAVLITKYRQLVLERRKRYSEASILYRLGRIEIEFPQFSFKPPTHRRPRIIPFTPLSLEDLQFAA
ncbi:MAG: hypothetical protein K1X79_04135 [Oligoflexia bacterium]|nr:hypothetical protein [Oligoflexia bacterium]